MNNLKKLVASSLLAVSCIVTSSAHAASTEQVEAISKEIQRAEALTAGLVTSGINTLYSRSKAAAIAGTMALSAYILYKVGGSDESTLTRWASKLGAMLLATAATVTTAGHFGVRNILLHTPDFLKDAQEMQGYWSAEVWKQIQTNVDLQKKYLKSHKN